MDEEIESNESNDILPLETRIARTAITARSCRRRRKIYIELLENKVTELCEELEKAKKDLEQTKYLLW